MNVLDIVIEYEPGQIVRPDKEYPDYSQYAERLGGNSLYTVRSCDDRGLTLKGVKGMFPSAMFLDAE